MKSLLIFAFMLIVVTNNLLSIDSKSEIPIPFKEKVSFPSILSEELPEDFPEMRIETVDSPFPGYIFMECFNVNGSEPNYIMITDELGSVVYYSKKENQGADFKMQPNGRYSYASRVKLGDKYQAGPLTVQNIMVQHNIMDSEFNVIDTIQMQNEYLADMHEFVILPNGNYLMLSYEGVPVDMSKVIPGGNPNAKVVGTVLQEVDKDNKCVFQWKSLDYIPILATKDDVRKQTFEHVHGNSMFLDKDGNLIVSFPTSFEIVKIDMVTGELIWRFGGDENDFEISGDNPTDAPYYFRMQHDAHRLDNGNLIFYDNAVMKKSGWSSRAVEYEFDEENRKANLVWEYKHDPPVSAYAMGSVQRLDNGNTLINWGLNFTGLHRTMTEVTHDKSITYELSMPSLTFSYRAQKNNLPPCEPVADIDKFEMLQGNTYD
ncbi:MAG: aryl-sulfate sulfotransferase, partial [Candidatus Kapaibacterium sp.]